MLILIYDLRKIPTLKCISSNTDACQFEVDDTYMNDVQEVINNWQKRYRLELERDDVLKIVMKDINNYCEILQTNKGKQVNFKGGCFAGCPDIKIHENGKLETIYKDSYKANSMVIVAEAILKYLLFNIPIEKTINNCNDIFKFQQISHLGSTYEKCVQESENGDIELQRNNRIYAGLKPSGVIIKVKPNGRRDSLANCPPNPIVDNGNKCTIEDINKEWYIEFAQEKANDFLGIPRLDSLKKEELLERAKGLGLEIDKKTKKDDIIKMIKNKERNEVKNMATKQDIEKELEETKEKLNKAVTQNEQLMNKIKESENVKEMKFADERLNDNIMLQSSLYKKINELRKYIRSVDFVYDEELPSNLGGGEYYSIGQLYDALQKGCLEVGLDFSHDVVEVISFDKELVKPSGKLPIHVATVKTKSTLTDINTGISKDYITIAQGSDTIDKAISGASTLAFRQWFTKNFSPKNANDDDNVDETPKSEEPKVPVYIPESKKEEIKEEVVKQVQQEDSDDEDIKVICQNIMAIREKTGNEEYGKTTMQALMSGILSSADILEIDLKIKQKMESVGLNV